MLANNCIFKFRECTSLILYLVFLQYLFQLNVVAFFDLHSLINNLAVSNVVLYVMPDLIRYPVFFLDSGFRRCDDIAASRGECTRSDSMNLIHLNVHKKRPRCVYLSNCFNFERMTEVW
jgi:hypothetical protein